MNKDPLFFINHILENINDIELFSQGLTKEQFEKDKLRQKAIIKSIEIIGEATKNISKEIMIAHPEVPWKEIIGTRDILIHQYFGVDFTVVWKIITKDLSVFKKQIINIKKFIESKHA